MKRVLLALFIALNIAIALAAKSPAQVGVTTYGPYLFTDPGSLPPITLTGESTCAVTIDATAGSADFTPWGSGDGGVTQEIVRTIGQQTISASGPYTIGGPISPYLTQFYTQVDNVSGAVFVTETCSGAVSPESLAFPTATPTAAPTFSPTPVPTAPTPTPSPTPTNCPQAVLGAKPLLYYKLDELASAPPHAPADSSGHSYTGTLKNSGLIAAQQPPLTLTPPAGDYSYQFTRPGYIAAPTTVPYGPTFTFVAFVSPLASGGWPAHLCIIYYHGQCLAITNGRLGWGQTAVTSGYISDATRVLAISAAPHFVTLVEDQTVSPPSVKVAIDGGTLTNANPAGLALATFKPYTYVRTYLGGDLTATYQDDVAVYPYTFSQGQVTAMATFCPPIAAPTPTASPTPIPPGNYQAAVLALHPVAYYRLGEPSGTTATDISGNSYNGTVTVPGSTTLGSTGLLASDVNTAYAFTANSAYVTLPGAIPNNKAFTVAFLIKATSYAGTNYVLNYAHRTFGIAGNHPIYNYANVGSNIHTFSGITLTNGTAYWIAFTQNYGAGNVSVTVNGAALTTATGVAGWFGGATPSYINKAYSTTTNGLVGTVDEVAIFPTILTQAQLTALSTTAGYP